MVRKGQSIGDDPKKPYARVHSILMAQLDDTPPDNIDWMPAHSTKEQVGTVMRGDGKLMTEVDRRANEQADILAKRGASLHRVPITEVDDWKRHFKMVKAERYGLGKSLLQRTMESHTRSGIRRRPGGKLRRRRGPDLLEKA